MKLLLVALMHQDLHHELLCFKLTCQKLLTWSIITSLSKVFRSLTYHLLIKDSLTAIYVADNPESNSEAKHQLPEM
jgi:hypothetical protein